jgi:uncharacterized OsmC-like protein
MTPLPHVYMTRLDGGPHDYATIVSAGLPRLAVASPAEFGGPGDAWSPEHLLLASVQACYLFTLRAVARAMAVSFEALEVEAQGVVDRQAGVTRFTEITLRFKLTLPAEADLDRIALALEKTKKACLISSSLSTPVRADVSIVKPGLPPAEAAVA